MISNGTIRKYVTERIKPYKGKVFGYALIYNIIAAMISGIFGFAARFIVQLLAIVLIIPLVMLTGQNESLARGISSILSFSLATIASTLISIFTFILSIGYLREILLSVNDNNIVSPVDFFNLAFKDGKRTAVTYLRLILKYLPSYFLITIGATLAEVGASLGGDSTINIVLVILGLGIMLVGVIWCIAILLLYQSVPYELVYDEVSSPKEIIKNAREKLKGHTWQWTRMNYFYSFIFFMISLAFVIIGVLLMGIMTGLMSTGENAALIAGFVFMFVGIFAIIVCGVAVWLAMTYFTAKNMLNLDELYKAILKEKNVE